MIISPTGIYLVGVNIAIISQSCTLRIVPSGIVVYVHTPIADSIGRLPLHSTGSNIRRKLGHESGVAVSIRSFVGNLSGGHYAVLIFGSIPRLLWQRLYRCLSALLLLSPQRNILLELFAVNLAMFTGPTCFIPPLAGRAGHFLL
jgi:hypothetical protein